MKPSVPAILLTTHNGEDWLQCLLDSLAAQDLGSFHVFISDDASTDGTPAILEDFSRGHPGLCTVYRQAEPLGCAENFRFLLKGADAPYYFFCDQDDWWRPHKLSRMIGALKDVAPGAPAFAFSDLEVVDEALRPLHPSLWGLQRTDPSIVGDLRLLHICNVVTGCALAINRAAKDLVADIPFTPYHDQAIAIELVRKGAGAIAIGEPLVKYRQHRRNLVGARGFLSGLPRGLVALFAGKDRVLARRGLDHGIFASFLDYYSLKAGFWVRRALNLARPR